MRSRRDRTRHGLTCRSWRRQRDVSRRKQIAALLFKVNKRLNKAYLHTDSFGHLWDFQHPAWARKFFLNWCEALKWQRLEPFRKFAWMIVNHWDGIEAYCQLKDKVPTGFVEGLNNQIRALRQRAFGDRG